MTCIVHEHGYWIGAEELPHRHDAGLASALRDLLSGMMTVDLGCGDGYYVNTLDGNPETPAIAGDNCQVADVTSETFDVQRYDAVLFLEVGEHIPAQYEDQVIANVAKTAKDMIVLSWATPGQTGLGHVNCRWPADILPKFKAYGFVTDQAASAVLREQATLGWFKNNLLVLRKE